MPAGVYSDLDYQFRWAIRDIRNPINWTAEDRLRRCHVCIISPRWNNPADLGVGWESLDNPYGQGKAISNALNLVDVGAFFNTFNVNPTGTYDSGISNLPSYLPPFAAQDGCAHPLNDDLPLTDMYGAWARECRNNSLHNFSATLSQAGTQGWFEPYFRFDETVNAGGKVETPFWLVNARDPNFPSIFSDFILANFGWADGLNFEYWAIPSWYKNWTAPGTYWAGLTGPQRDTYTNEWETGILSAISTVRASKPNWTIIGQQTPYSPSTKPRADRTDGYFRENNPFAFGGFTTNAQCIADDKEHRLAIFTDNNNRKYTSLWHVWVPSNYSNEAIDNWKLIARDSQSYMAIGDGSTAWEAPPNHA